MMKNSRRMVRNAGTHSFRNLADRARCKKNHSAVRTWNNFLSFEGKTSALSDCGEKKCFHDFMNAVKSSIQISVGMLVCPESGAL